ncbi:hypothetical protein [Cryobacterium zongtaii]|uniref:hypothetical protein n=1 Tax=Cryobacterium zongtaii TaxID=1259217 RepID=UPI001056F868|nr:hypothetical protein [Cryobacterium zongtaii]
MPAAIQNASEFVAATSSETAIVAIAPNAPASGSRDSSDVLHVAASSSERASDVEEEQLGAHEGPCLDAYRSGSTIEVHNIKAIATAVLDDLNVVQKCHVRGPTRVIQANPRPTSWLTVGADSAKYQQSRRAESQSKKFGVGLERATN